MSGKHGLQGLMHRTGRITSVLKRTKSLQIMAVLFVAIFLLSLAGGCDSFLKIQLDHLYEDTITASDTRDGTLRAHVYTLDAETSETYIFTVESTSTASIQVWECNGRSAQILEAWGGGGEMVVYWTFDSDGEKDIWVEAFVDECPAPYKMTITKLEF